MINYIVVFLGGGIGAVVRFVLATWIGHHERYSRGNGI